MTWHCWLMIIKYQAFSAYRDERSVFHHVQLWPSWFWATNPEDVLFFQVYQSWSTFPWTYSKPISCPSRSFLLIRILLLVRSVILIAFCFPFSFIHTNFVECRAWTWEFLSEISVLKETGFLTDQLWRGFGFNIVRVLFIRTME